MPLQGPQSIVQPEDLSVFHMLSDNGLMSQPGGPLQLLTTQSQGSLQWQLKQLLLMPRSTPTAEFKLILSFYY